MNPNRITLATILKRIFILTALICGMAFFMSASLDAFEHQECWRMKTHHDAGYPTNPPPEWCAPYFVEESH